MAKYFSGFLFLFLFQFTFVLAEFSTRAFVLQNFANLPEHSFLGGSKVWTRGSAVFDWIGCI